MGRPKGAPNKNPKIKIEAWKLLENKMVDDFSQKVITIMNRFYREKKYREFMRLYIELTKYFKPTLKAIEKDINVDYKIEIVGDPKLIKKLSKQ